MEIGLLQLVADLHTGTSADSKTDRFLQEIANGLGLSRLPLVSAEDLPAVGLPVIFVRSGGTEGLFKQVYENLSEPYILLASGQHNSLAASLEILSFLKQQGLRGEVLHGTPEYIVERLKVINRIVAVQRELSRTRLGVVGKPSDWLIASEVDSEWAREIFGLSLVNLEMAELTRVIDQVDEVDSSLAERFDYADEVKHGSLRIYSALKELAGRHNLQGITVRCFDLLGQYQNTGCLGLSLLNDEGIIAGCEGDVPALITMFLLSKLTGEPTFMANPSRIDVASNQVVLAHCTVPLSMTERFTLDTHFESGLGVAVRGEIAPGRCTIFKVGADCTNYFVSGGHIEENLTEEHLCRTQLRVKLDEDVRYFLKEPLGNHHIICRGEHSELIHEFMESL